MKFTYRYQRIRRIPNGTCIGHRSLGLKITIMTKLWSILENFRSTTAKKTTTKPKKYRRFWTSAADMAASCSLWRSIFRTSSFWAKKYVTKSPILWLKRQILSESTHNIKTAKTWLSSGPILWRRFITILPKTRSKKCSFVSLTHISRRSITGAEL